MLPVTRRGLQIALGALWTFDAALQMQPYMFTRSFADEVIAPSGDGQPWVVAAPVHLAATAVAAHPVVTNAAFALIQLLIGLGLLWRRSARAAIFATFAWSFAVWWVGEGLGGLLGGHAMLLNGAPGAVLLYAVVAAAALGDGGGDGRGEAPRGWVVSAWVALWSFGALLQLLPGASSASAVSDALADAADATPSWLHGLAATVTSSVAHHAWVVIVLICVQVSVAAAAMVRNELRLVSVICGGTIAVAFWVFGQGLGELATGTSTDPNSAPLLILLGCAVAAHVKRGRPVRAGARATVGAAAPASSPA